MEQLVKNLNIIKEHMRRKGFRVPCASDKRVIDMWDLKTHCCNSAHMQQFLVTKSIYGKHMFTWEGDAGKSFEGMHGDEMGLEINDVVDEDEAAQLEEAAAFAPFELEDFCGPGEGFNVLPCPSRLPHDLEVAQKIARWFGPPYNKWYVGNITEVNKRRTKSENISAEFEHEEDGTTWGHFNASAEDYGADKLWVVLEPIALDVDPSPDTPASRPSDAWSESGEDD